MRYLKPHYYNTFQCIAGQCPDTCCAGWQIMIDDDSLNRYAEIKGDFGRRLRNSIDWMQGSFLQNHRRCIFLNKQNLCDIYRELGPDAICETCRMYPRHVEEYEGLRELSITLSCPAAAEIILGCREKVRFEESFSEEEDDFEEFDFLMFSQLEDARDVIFRILQNRGLMLPVRMQAVFHLAKDFQKCTDEGRTCEIDEMLAGYDERNKCGNFETWIAAPESFYEDRLRELSLLNSLERLFPEWDDVLNDTQKLLYDEGSRHYAQLYREFQSACGYDSPYKEQWSVIGEQLMMFFVYTYFCGSVYDNMVSSKMGIALFSTVWIQELVMLRWLQNGRAISFSDITEMAWRFAREVEHSDDNLNALEDWLEEML